MKLDLSKLSDAVTAVAGISTARDAAVAQANALLEDAKASQAAVDTLTASLIAATTSPAEAVGIAAVAAALAPVDATLVAALADPAPAIVAPVMVNDPLASLKG